LQITLRKSDGWKSQPAKRDSRALMKAAERSEKTKAVARSKFEQSQQAAPAARFRDGAAN